MRIAVFASGSGSNAEAIIQATKKGTLDAEVALIVTDKPGAKVVERAQSYGIDVFAFTPKDYNGKAAFEQEIVSKLKEYDISFLVLAGYMRLVGETLLEGYEGRMVNIHPSLLPSFPGLDAIGQAFDAKVKITGVTIHYVDSGMDSGPIIAQESVRIEEMDTIETLRQKVQAIEHTLYPETLQKIFTSKEYK
ncbi:phosphoribosylglycinamide formyltransferase [Halalkalibacter sp. AB-rgal2]|uniref:phosphoribosylglycinamide formyltransferase n=1 Tax=Halalkalibacter sp. AB-rgal2 TaxID=3242695 RepID=UPI00359D7A42